MEAEYVGMYCIGGKCGFCIRLTKKPNWFRRFFMKNLLGFKWYNI